MEQDQGILNTPWSTSNKQYRSPHKKHRDIDISIQYRPSLNTGIGNFHITGNYSDGNSSLKMAQRKIDRYEQMSKQEELIAKKRREILEKQRTTELAKAVAMAMKESKSKEGSSTNNCINGETPIKEEEKEQEENGNEKKEPESTTATTTTTTASSNTTTTTITTTTTTTTATTTTQGRNSLAGRMGKILFGLKRSHSQVAPPLVDQPPPKVQNSFCNDGSFLDHFKKIIEKQEKPKILTIIEPPLPEETEIKTEPIENDDPNNCNHMQTMLPPPSTQCNAIPTPVTVAVSLAGPQTFAFNPNFLPQGILLPPQQPPHPSEPPQPMTAAFFGSPFANFAPPPPPPPQLPISLANLSSLYMIPAPEPLQLSAIQAPKEFDLNAIPKPQLNLDAIQVPAPAEQFPIIVSPPIETIKEEPQLSPPPLEQNQQQQSDDNDHNCIQLPTTIENLIALVADNGDDYEEKIRTQKSRLHPAMWFLFDKHCQQYQEYQQELKTELLRRSQTQIKIESAVSTTQPEGNIAETADKYDPETAFGGDPDSDDEYMRNMHDRNRKNLERRIEILNELSDAEKDALDREVSQDGETTTSESAEKRRKQRKSRWGEKVPDEPSASSTTSTVAASTPPTAAAASSSSSLTSFGNQHKPLLSTITRTDPGLLQYARQNYGSTSLTEEDWKKCEEHYKVNLLYQDMMRKRQEIDRLARSGKFKYEYDSDEDINGGTWEHKLRTAEMVATQAWASALTKQSEGKHHIGDFLPPEELKKFMEQYEAKKNNRAPDLSDYKEYKLKEDNIGFKMLQKLGWKEGQGLGTDGAGIVDPVNKGPQRDGNQGLGVQSSVAAEDCDNEYDAYRKRMMLAYRFRPNPLNNPRRAYY